MDAILPDSPHVFSRIIQQSLLAGLVDGSRLFRSRLQNGTNIDSVSNLIGGRGDMVFLNFEAYPAYGVIFGQCFPNPMRRSSSFELFLDCRIRSKVLDEIRAASFEGIRKGSTVETTKGIFGSTRFALSNRLTISAGERGRVERVLRDPLDGQVWLHVRREEDTASTQGLYRYCCLWPDEVKLIRPAKCTAA